MTKMRDIMGKLSNQDIKSLNGHRVIEMRDYARSVVISERGEEKIALPKADVVTLLLDDESNITVRPSGTEPKCKFYFGVKGTSAETIKIIPNLLFVELKEKLDI